MSAAVQDERRLPPDAGLTILELMIVLVILSLIGVVVSVQVLGQMDRAKVDIARLQLRQMQTALTLFSLDTRAYPTSEEGLAALLSSPKAVDGWRGPYVKNADALLDPWGQKVSYAPTPAGGYVLASLGSDRKPGGEGAAQDLELADTQ
jgi:general secretion pathway protein G